jgi:predicted site-specific integrase-resolvase
VTVEQAAQMIGVSSWSMYGAIKRGEAPMPVIRVGRRIVVPTQPLRELLGLNGATACEPSNG